MKAQVTQLKASTDNNWLNEQRTEEVKGIVRDVMADADSRASLQGTGAAAGYNRGFFIASEDGKFLLRVGALTQLRYAADIRQNAPAAGVVANGVPGNGAPYNVTNGFEVRRFEPSFSGYVGDPRIQYMLLLQANGNSDAITLRKHGSTIR